ncbi:MAG: CDP-glucose 4,6-dehydratase [Rhabdaerophilum sp.]
MIAARLPDPAFWAGKRVLVTGHTGFKGSWLALWLNAMGAKVTGLALAPETTPSLFGLANIGTSCRSEMADLRDLAAVQPVVAEARPEIVLHLAAQALVRRSYREPGATFAINAQGTANLLDALAEEPDLKAILAITSDKVYANDETGRAFREEDALGGHDPYSLSKAAAEHVVAGFRAAIFEKKGIALATARGGNVIGGGDYSEDRIVPDIVRSATSGVPLVLRNPSATRPWQHVLDCLSGYLVFAEKLASDKNTPTALNIGPDPAEVITVADIAEAMLPGLGAKSPWQRDPTAANAPREMQSLSLDPTKARALGIGDHLPGRLAVDWTAEWYRAYAKGKDARDLTLEQIAAYSRLN